jgi:predicted porin
VARRAARAALAGAPHDHDNKKGAPQLIRRLGLAALLFLLSFAARAQLDYAAFGTLDLSYGRFENSGADPRHRWNSNSLSASFVGARASYGFENGLTVGANLETFIRFEELDYGRNEQDPFLSRNNFVSLQHNNFGLLRLGRMQTPLFETSTRLNAFGNSTGFSPALRQIFLSGNLESIDGDFYWDRAVSYKTPQIEDLNLQGHLMYAQDSGDTRGDYFGGSLVYSRGLLAVSLVAQDVHVNNGIDDEIDERTLQVGAAYTFGIARVFGQYTHIDDNGNDVKSKIGTVGVSVPVGPGTVLAQIARSTSKGPAVDRKHTTTSLGYVYNYEGIADFYILAMDDRISKQTRGVSYAAGIRYQFSVP